MPGSGAGEGGSEEGLYIHNRVYLGMYGYCYLSPFKDFISIFYPLCFCNRMLIYLYVESVFLVWDVFLTFHLCLYLFSPSFLFFFYTNVVI